MSAIDDVFKAITEEVPRGTVRMQLLTNVTAAQIQSIPLGSDVALFSPSGIVQHGVFDEEARANFISCTEQNECGHLHGYLVYTPPFATEDTALSADDIASMYVSKFEGAIRKARSDDPDPDWSERDVLELMVRDAVLMARDGMMFPPF